MGHGGTISLRAILGRSGTQPDGYLAPIWGIRGLPGVSPAEIVPRIVPDFVSPIVPENCPPKPLCYLHLKWAALDSNQRLPPCEDGQDRVNPCSFAACDVQILQEF